MEHVLHLSPTHERTRALKVTLREEEVETKQRDNKGNVTAQRDKYP